MAKAFKDITQQEAFSLVTEPDDYAEIFDYLYNDDHWRGGKGFVGPTTSTERSEAQSAAVREGWSRRFVSENTLKEIVKRARDGVIGKEPFWQAQLMRPLEPEEEEGGDLPADEQQRLDETNEALTEWWDGMQGVIMNAGQRRKASVHKMLKEYAFAIRTFGRAGIRIRIPHGRLSREESGDGSIRLVLDADGPKDALGSIFAECIMPNVGRMYTDPDSMKDLGVVQFEDQDEIDKSTRIRYAELTYHVDARGAAMYGQDRGEPLTSLRITYGDGKDDYEQTFDLRGNLLFHEGVHEALVTPQMLEQQKAYNTESTELGIVLDQEGFPEVILTNTLGPGTWETDTATGKEKFIPTAYGRGPGKRAFMMGEPLEESGMIRGYTTPGVHQLEPANIEGYIKGKADRRLSMLRQSKQSFVEIMDDATASGESRIQALFDFLLDAGDFKAVMDASIKWLLETAWSLALDVSGSPGRDHDIKIVADCKINVPWIPASMREALLKEMQQGVRSRETTMSDLGIEDVDAEKQRIAASNEYKIDQRGKQAEVIKGVGDKLSIRSALDFAGVSEDEAEEIMQREGSMEAQTERLRSTRARENVRRLTQEMNMNGNG